MKCFFHNADLDGHCSGAIVKYFNPDCEMRGINYGDPFPWLDIAPDERVFMVDFCLQPASEMADLAAKSRLIWIDHHNTAINSMVQIGVNPFGVRDLSRAACELSWDYFAEGQEMPIAVYLLGRYDVWDHSDKYTLPFQYGMRLRDTNPEDDRNMNFWSTLFGGGIEIIGIVEKGRAIIQYSDKLNADYCKAYAFDTIMPPGIPAICVNKGFTGSLAFKSVYDPTRHSLMIGFCRRNEQWGVRLYSDKPEIDCGAIAKEYGGGGHKGAAGFKCKRLPFRY